MTMVNVEDESVHGGAGDGDGTVNDDIAGSVAGEIGLSAKKLIHEASRSMELASSQPDASTILPTQLTVLFGRKVSVSDEIEQKRSAADWSTKALTLFQTWRRQTMPLIRRRRTTDNTFFISVS
ncbi:uncharacterized protein LOC125596758 isoform X1 [Brassica napus]|uniref:uncharacterized protein LOC125596758 isoform X1 n=1 Tax=Brassica napus TaxID=3708 RepID=UPI00207853A9|nr:uncharacterized protein LOC125596758 isoform X1 [Brassica napus]